MLPLAGYFGNMRPVKEQLEIIHFFIDGTLEINNLE